MAKTKAKRREIVSFFSLHSWGESKQKSVNQTAKNAYLKQKSVSVSRMVEGSFYPAHMRQETASTQDTLAAMLASIQENPDLGQQLLQNLLLNAVPAQKDV